MEKERQKTIAILYSDAKREYFSSEEQYITEVEVFERAKIIAPYFEKIGFKVNLLPGNSDLPNELKKFKPDIVLNLVDSVRGQEHLSAIIPAILDLFNLQYIGTGMLGLTINSNKFLTKKILEQANLPLPRYQLFNSSNDPLNSCLKFPLISKLNAIHGSVAIDQNSVSENELHLRERLRKLIKTYRQPILVEEFIVGKELTAYLLEGINKKVYIGEKIFNHSSAKFKLATFDAVWRNINSYNYARSNNHGILENYARIAFDVLKMDDYGKFDVRQDESGRYYFIDCNANPAFGPLETDCAISHIMKMYNIDFSEIIRRLIINANKPY
ncbi:MAG: hypothetical protein ABIJ91_05700 [Candidatus Kuenenbacteria bacterium]